MGLVTDVLVAMYDQTTGALGWAKDWVFITIGTLVIWIVCTCYMKLIHIPGDKTMVAAFAAIGMASLPFAMFVFCWTRRTIIKRFVDNSTTLVQLLGCKLEGRTKEEIIDIAVRRMEIWKKTISSSRPAQNPEEIDMALQSMITARKVFPKFGIPV